MGCKIPKTLRIIGKDYIITTNHKQGSVGECDVFKQEINVDLDYPIQQVHDTLLHEVIHAIDHAMKSKLSEEQVAATATGLYAVFNDNPELLAWFTAKSSKKSKS